MRDPLKDPEPEYTLHKLAGEVGKIKAAYLKAAPFRGRMLAEAHEREDALLERYVRDRGYEGDRRAALLVELLDLKRTRWYA